jgi:hypothetical protein
MFFYAKKILFSCSLKCAIDHDQAISNKFFTKVLNSVKWEKHPVESFYHLIIIFVPITLYLFVSNKNGLMDRIIIIVCSFNMVILCTHVHGMWKRMF